MRSLLYTALIALPLSAAHAGPLEDAFALVEGFKRSYDARDAVAITRLFAPNAVFLGTTMAKPTTRSEDILAYFQASATRSPQASVIIENHEAFALSDNAYVFSGQNVFRTVQDGKETLAPARFTIVVAKGAEGWRIAHFHSSRRP
jgi:uncharacterized protein (TIGR02246 family)